MQRPAQVLTILQGVPPQESADRVRELYSALTQADRALIDTRDALYRATYEASLEGWSDRALGKAIGVPYPTVQGWREIGRGLAEQE
jgi:hypothetical protein